MNHILAIDYGLKRTGIAFAIYPILIAHPYKTVPTKELDFLDPKKISSKIYKVDPEKNAFENATGIAKNMYTDLILKEKVKQLK